MRLASKHSGGGGFPAGNGLGGMESWDLWLADVVRGSVMMLFCVWKETYIL